MNAWLVDRIEHTPYFSESLGLEKVKPQMVERVAELICERGGQTNSRSIKMSTVESLIIDWSRRTDWNEWRYALKEGVRCQEEVATESVCSSAGRKAVQIG